jgi:hypothetical protein
MAAGPSIDVTGWLEEQLAQASPDLLRSMVQTFAEALMGAEADAVCGAGYGERSAEGRVRDRGVCSRGRGRCDEPSPVFWWAIMAGCRRSHGPWTTGMTGMPARLRRLPSGR